jgi:predicted TIM-barrel fold metal-dependent hydrolase
MKNGNPLVDVNAWLGSWPFQYVNDDTARLLEARLLAEGIDQAFVGSPEAAFNPDCMAANQVHLVRLAGSSVLRPVMALDPTKGDWKDILSLSRDKGVAAIRLFPGYHCYELSSAPALAAIEAIAKAGTFALFVQMRMEDERTHHPLCKIPAVSVPSIVDMANQFPGLTVVAICPYNHEARELGKGPANLLFEISHVETLRTIASLLEAVPAERVLFGTHAPFLQPRAAVMKIHARYVPDDAQRIIGIENARRILGKALGPARKPAPPRKAAAPKKAAAARKPAARTTPKKTARKRR